ncbi:hypothetical protein S40293_03937 [Stachybotrys chartarum IBT 40293]|nr:hypothetical protein S40293_03937 [Stachybotrys chartarum IBT 40293]
MRSAQFQHSGTSASEIATMRSLLVPAAQGGSRRLSQPQDVVMSPAGDTPVYDNRHQTQQDVMESLCLRRDLSRPEDPPFGMWWTYTVEETLLWPILGYSGNVNSGLDVVMLDSEGDTGSEDEYDDQNNAGCAQQMHERSPGSPLLQGYLRPEFTDMMDRRGLDDGTVVPGLIENFLKNVHSKCPILNPDELRVHGANLVENGLSWDATSCQVLLACALGAISCPWNIEEDNDFATRRPSSALCLVAREYFEAAQKRLGPLYTSPSLIAVQCIYMAGTFFMYLQRPLAGWRMLNTASIACRAYISKKVAKESMGLRHVSSRSLEQRLYWSCFNAEREVACEFGMETAGLNVIAYSTVLPTPPSGYADDWTRSRSSLSRPCDAQTPDPPNDTNHDKSWYLFLTDIMLRKLEMRIDTYTQEKRREAYRRAGDSHEAFYQSLYEANQEFDYQLTCYYDSLPPMMKFPLDDLVTRPDELRDYLRWRLYSVRHDICMPSFYALINNDTSQWAKSLVDGLVAHASIMLRLDIAFLWTASSTHRNHNTWLALRKGVRAGLVLVAARRLKAQNRPELAALRVPDDETFRRGAQALVRGLKYWQAELRDCATNLDILRSLHPDFEDEEHST